MMIWVGAVLIIASVVVMVVQPLRRGQLSGGQLGSGGTADTLEPRRPSVGFGFKWNWPALALFGVGAILMLTAASFDL
jgi:hypothetical protein